uniref:Uncharacterized protein n=1 Tax=Gorilla gorilla gorilla TaxID=9595 RepID=A0A2I2ZGQ8_GORGO
TLRLSTPHRTAVVHCFSKKLNTILFIFISIVFASMLCHSWVKLYLINSKIDIFPTYYHC